MKAILVAALIATTSFAVPTVLIVTPAAATICPEYAPEGHKRPGGYCELRDNTATLAAPVASPPAAEAAPSIAPPGGGGGCTSIDLRKLLKHLPIGARVLSAC